MDVCVQEPENPEDDNGPRTDHEDDLIETVFEDPCATIGSAG